MSLCLARKARISLRRAGDEGRGHQVEKIEHEHFLRRVAHGCRIVDHHRARLQPLEQMRGGDVGHVEGRILPQLHHIVFGEVDGPRMRQPVMRARLVLDRETMALGDQLAVAQRKVVRRVVEHVVPAPLRFEQQREGGIAPDIDALDRVHLEGDFEGHGAPLLHGKGVLDIARPGPRRRQHHVESDVVARVIGVR